MKKKILLAVLMVAMLVCLFAISVGASDLAYDRVYTVNGVEYPLWEQDAEGNYHPLMWYQDGDKLSKVYADNTDSTKAPYVSYTKYVDSGTKEIKTVTITDATGKTFGGKETVVIANLHNIYLKAGDNSQITLMNKTAFGGSTVLKAIYIPESIKTMGWVSNDNFVPFASCKALEYVEIAPSAEIKTIGPNTFLNCTSLKAVSLPDGITKLGQISFSGCTSLQAVYLPKSLEVCEYNGWDKGAFYNCSSAYLVNEPFVIENIATDIPAKPDIYYFPSNFSAIGDAFRNWSNINDTIVFGEKLLVVDGNGFTNTGVAGQNKTAVFTGEMTKFYLGDGIALKWNFVFTNTTDESIFSTRNDRGYAGSTGYLCKSNRIVKFGYGVKFEDGTTHFVDVRKSEVIGATCTTNEIATTYCFCGAKISTSEVENTKLGHEYDLAKGAVKSKIEYANYLAKGILNTKCARCEECDESSVAPIISSFDGFSTKIASDGLVIKYTVNKDAIDELVKVNGGSIELGFVVAAKHLASEELIGTDGKATANVMKMSVITHSAASESGVYYSGAELKITGAWDGTVDVNGVATDVKDVKFYMAGYIISNGVVSYLNKGGSSVSADYASYSDMIEA